MYTCSTCNNEWPENYCPVCARTIVRPPAIPRPPEPPVSSANPVADKTAPRISSPPPPAVIKSTAQAVKPAQVPPASSKGRILGSLIFLGLGLFLLTLGFFLPIHWARTDPHGKVTIAPQMLIMAPMLILMAGGILAGIEDKRLLSVLCGVGVGIGIFLWIILEAILHGIMNAH